MARGVVRWSSFAIVLIMCATVLRARAEVPAEWTGLPVVAIEVDGEVTTGAAAEKLGIPLGSPLVRGLLRGAIERLVSEGRWADIQVDGHLDGGGVRLSFELVPRIVLRRVDVVGNRAIDNQEIVRLLGLAEQAEIAEARFPELETTLREAYAEHGYHEARASFILRDTDEPALKVLRVEVTEGEPTRIRSIDFRGEALPRRRGVRRLLGLGLGDIADLTRIEEGLERTVRVLRQNGYYGAELANPRLERDGHEARLVIDSTIGLRFEVHFQGAGPMSQSELFVALGLEQERFSGEASLRAIENKIAEYYRRYGFRDVQVSARMVRETRVVGEEPGSRYEEHVNVIVVSIDRGEQLEIEAITFPGATHYETTFLREQVYSFLEAELPGSAIRATVDSEVADELGFGGSKRARDRTLPEPLILDPRRRFYAPTYERAVEHLRELYRGDGFLEVEVQPVVISPLPDRDKALAAIAITEGPRTFLYDARVENNRALASRELLKAASLSRGAAFSYQRVEEARVRMVSAAQEEGYFFARVEPRVRFSSDGTRAEVTFRIDEGYQVRVAGIEIRGAERSNGGMIRDRAKFRVGEIYTPSRAREAQSSLLALDVFSSVTVGPDEPNLPARAKNIIVTVTERKTQWLGWSAGFSTGEGVRGGLEYGYRNLFGSAVHAAFRGQLGYQFVFLDEEAEVRYKTLPEDQRVEYTATLSFGVPYLPRLSKLAAGLDISAITDIQRDFRMQKESGVASLTYRPAKPYTITTAQELEFSDFSVFEQNAFGNIGNLPVSALVPAGRNTLVSLQLAGAWDHRDRAFNAHRGFLVSATSEYARTLNADYSVEREGGMSQNVEFLSNMLRFTLSFAFYIPLGPKVTFASQTRYGRVVHLQKKSEAYPNRRFYLGGPNFRGWYQNQMIPQDLERRDGDEEAPSVFLRGADTFIASQNELRFPLLGELYGAVFTDVGNLWAIASNFDLTELETVVGLGIRFNTPVASLAFDYGLRAEQRDPLRLTGVFQFAFQTF